MTQTATSSSLPEQQATTPPTPVWLFPTETAQVFGGWNSKSKMFIFGCVIPEKTREITYWPGSVKVPDVEVPVTVMLQHMPIMYQKRRSNVPGTEVACTCCSTPDITPHLANFVTSHFSVYQLFKKKKKNYIRRLTMGNNQKNPHPEITSRICWGGHAYQIKCLREAHNKFWSNHFSFSYTGKEKSLDDPDGYIDFLHTYKKKSNQIAKGCKDREIDLIAILSKLNPLLTSLEPHTGISVDFSDFPAKPKIYWADKKSDGTWTIDGKPDSNISIQLGFTKKII